MLRRDPRVNVPSSSALEQQWSITAPYVLPDRGSCRWPFQFLVAMAATVTGQRLVDGPTAVSVRPCSPCPFSRRIWLVGCSFWHGRRAVGARPRAPGAPSSCSDSALLIWDRRTAPRNARSRTRISIIPAIGHWPLAPSALKSFCFWIEQFTESPSMQVLFDCHGNSSVRSGRSLELLIFSETFDHLVCLTKNLDYVFWLTRVLSPKW
jgi:hypothetical protein